MLASSTTGSAHTVTTHTTPELIASLPNAGSGISGAVGTSSAKAATGTKVAVGAIAAAATAGVGLRTLIDDGDGQSIVFADSMIVSVANNPAVEENSGSIRSAGLPTPS